MNKGRKNGLFVLFLILSLALGMNAFVYGEEIPQEQRVSESQEEQPKLTVEEVTFGLDYDVKLTDIQQSDYDYIVFKVWQELDGEDCAKLYPAEWIADEESLEENENPYYFAHLLINDQDQPDIYHVVAYGLSVPESITIESPEDITIDMITDGEMSFEIDKTSFTTILADEDGDKDEEKENGDAEPETDSEEIAKEEPPVIAPKAALKAAASSSGIRGIDVSHWNGTIDWAKVKNAGIKYAIIRCGYGDNITSQDDSQWTRNISECERLGIPYGVYIYSHISNMTHALSEADHCIRLLKGHRPAYPVFLDLEELDDVGKLSNANLATFTEAWATKIRLAGYTPGVYSSKSWWTSKLTSSVYNNYCKWVAQWNTSCTYAGTYHAWQYSSEGQVNGISGNVDMDYWYGYNGGLGSSGGPYGSGPAFGLYEIVSTVNTNYAVDIRWGSTADKANIQLYSRNGTRAQKFWVIPLGYDNQYYIQNAASLKYLDVANNGVADYTNIWQYTPNASSAQRFRIYSTSTGDYEIQGVGSGKFVDLSGAKAADGTNIQIYTGNSTAAQKWNFVLTDDKLPDKGTYIIASAINRSFAMDISGASKASKANVQLYKRNNTNAQKFTIIPVGHDDLYYIVNKGSGKYLDVTNNGKTDKTNVWQYTRNGTQAQMFQVIPLVGGNFSIRGLSSGKYLDVNGGTAANGINIQIYTGNNTAAQKWYFVKTN